MASVAHQLVAVDRQRIDVKAGVVGLAVVALLGAAIIVVGPEFLAAVVGALMLLSADPPSEGGGWATRLLPLVVVGALLTFIAVSVGDQPLLSALIVGAAGVGGALHAGRSRRTDVRILIATLWLILALTLGGTGVPAWKYAAAFAVGAGLGAAAAWAKDRRAAHDGRVDDDLEPGTGERLDEADRLVRLFALLRGLALAAAVLIGFTSFPDHPAWVAITCLLVMRPPARQALVVGAQRSLGTGIGVLVAVALAGVVGDSKPALLVLLLASAFLMMAVREANYALFAALVTTFVVYSQRLVGADASESGSDRFLETLIGVALALAVLALAGAASRRGGA